MTDIDASIEQLRTIYRQLRENARARWNRDLPFEELLCDRWERAVSLGFGAGASIHQSSYVYGNVTVGEYTWIGPFTVLDGSGGLQIGCYCSISAGVKIYSHDSWKWAVTGGEAAYERAPVSIGDRCYIGSDTVIAKGVHIGEQSVIGACSFVNAAVPSRSIVAGAPCRVIGRVVGDGTAVRLEYDDHTR